MAMSHADVVDALLGELPAESVVADPDVVDGYRFDRAKTVVPGTPLALVRARLHRRGRRPRCGSPAALGIAVVTRGAGTGLSGGSAAIDGGITLSTERMRDVRVDAGAMVAVAQPGR